MGMLSLLMPLTLIICAILATCSALSAARADTTTALTTLNQTTTTAAAQQKLNSSSSSCFPLILRMTICLDFLVTGSMEPVPSDSCCLRLRWTGEIDFPCLCNILSSDKGWGRKLNRTRAESLPLSCGFRGSDNSLKTCRKKRTLDGVQPAVTPKP